MQPAASPQVDCEVPGRQVQAGMRGDRLGQSRSSADPIDLSAIARL
ncbi:hypothetical protein X742_24005 [Mesorhizobium sp. LNHC232B00]|nr:hypothetical protein X742_24005 [Mesorhizobium sp. LNHC232B00]